MMKKRLSVRRCLVLLMLILAPVLAKAQADFCGSRNTAFQEGEKMVFKVYYNMGAIWVGAGMAVFTTTLETINGRKAYHIAGDGKTLKSYDWFYKVRDLYESWVDAETMLPLRFKRNVNEGGYKFQNDVSFSHAGGKAVSGKKNYAIPKCTQDVLSAIFYARNIDYNKYKPGAKIPFTMFLDDQVYNLHITYLGKERIKTRFGTFNTIKISPKLVSGTIFTGGEKMMIWVSDDANKVPVRIDSPIMVGSIKVDLMSWEKLRNPFTGMVKWGKD